MFYLINEICEESAHSYFQKWRVIPDSVFYKILTLAPTSSEIFDLCEISDLLFFVSYCASQNKEIKLGNYFFDVCCAN